MTTHHSTATMLAWFVYRYIESGVPDILWMLTDSAEGHGCPCCRVGVGPCPGAGGHAVTVRDQLALRHDEALLIGTMSCSAELDSHAVTAAIKAGYRRL